MERPSSPFPLQTSVNCWRIETATRASVIIDAENYFRFARSAMLKADRRIMLIGWDFDARIDLGRSAEAEDAPVRVGEFISWLVERRPDLEVYLLRWDLGALKAVMRGTTLLTIARWIRHPRIHARLDSRHPVGASHHQKIVVIDDCFAFCGGIDMTGDRWDTRQHKDGDPGRHQPGGKPYKPWHDATTALEGPIAAALGDHARDRWRLAGGGTLAPVSGKSDCWPDELAPQFTDVEVAIARTSPKMPDQDAVVEIERLYLDQIAAAQRYVYAESQYFASRRIGEAIARRLDEKDGPEFVVINPLTAQGWLEPIAMDTARARLMEALRRRDRHGRLRMFHPRTAKGEPIYVHAKILIVDDRIVRVGSSNINNRSMRLDTECDVAIDATRQPALGLEQTIIGIRNDLLAEHLGTTVAAIADAIEASGSLIAAIEALRTAGKTLEPYAPPELGDIEAWLADNEVLDPEGPDEMFESLSRRGLFRRWRR
jgi:phosphatidylserine/phosphatidylglycerophosphate/cardiolipin synthase-like enzyme